MAAERADNVADSWESLLLDCDDLGPVVTQPEALKRWGVKGQDHHHAATDAPHLS